jgi:hypothetical protein
MGFGEVVRELVEFVVSDVREGESGGQLPLGVGESAVELAE